MNFWYVEIKIPIITPVSIHIVGNNFMYVGIVATLLLIGSIHNSMAPAIVAAEDKIIIGVLIRECSFMWIHGLHRLGLNIVTSMKRIEYNAVNPTLNIVNSIISKLNCDFKAISIIKSLE